MKIKNKLYAFLRMPHCIKYEIIFRYAHTYHIIIIICVVPELYRIV